MRTKLTQFAAIIMREKFRIIAAAITLFHAIGWSQEFTVTDLGTLGGSFSIATSVNNKGQVAGQSNTATQSQALGQADPFLYSNGAMIDLGNFGGDSVSNDAYYFTGNSANGVNDNGVVAGLAFDAGGNPHPFLWSAGTLQDLAPGQVGAASGINASNVAVGIIGFGSDGSGNFNGYGAVFNGGGSIAGVPVPSSLFISSPAAINNAGQIAGSCQADEDTIVFGCLANGTTAQELAPLSGYNFSFGNAINASGNSCGATEGPIYNDLADSVATAWIGGTPVNLGWPTNTENSVCNGMDDFGQYVGNANTDANNQIGFFYDPLNGAQDLNLLVPHGLHGPIGPHGEHFLIQNAVALSATGYIAADCVYLGGKTRACLLKANPVVILHNNVLTFAKTVNECIPCQSELAREARSLPKSLEGLTADERERVVHTVDLIGEQVDGLETNGAISQPTALLLIHDAELVLAAIDPKR
jgi:probable HAF family extracellular repeat protein